MKKVSPAISQTTRSNFIKNRGCEIVNDACHSQDVIDIVDPRAMQPTSHHVVDLIYEGLKIFDSVSELGEFFVQARNRRRLPYKVQERWDVLFVLAVEPGNVKHFPFFVRPILEYVDAHLALEPAKDWPKLSNECGAVPSLSRSSLSTFAKIECDRNDNGRDTANCLHPSSLSFRLQCTPPNPFAIHVLPLGQWRQA